MIHQVGVGASGENVVVFWFETLDGPADLYLARSSDGGKTFEEPIRVNPRKGSAFVHRRRAAFASVSAGGDVRLTWLEVGEDVSRRTRKLSTLPKGAGRFDRPIDLGQLSGASADPARPLDSEWFWFLDHTGERLDLLLGRLVSGKVQTEPLIRDLCPRDVPRCWKDEKGLGWIARKRGHSEKEALLVRLASPKGKPETVPVELERKLPCGAPVTVLPLSKGAPELAWIDSGRIEGSFLGTEDDRRACRVRDVKLGDTPFELIGATDPGGYAVVASIPADAFDKLEVVTAEPDRKFSKPSVFRIPVEEASGISGAALAGSGRRRWVMAAAVRRTGGSALYVARLNWKH